MGKKSARIPELREKSTELSCMWGFFASRKMISDGRRSGNKPVIEHPRKHEHLTSFDEECRKLKSEPDLASVTVDARQQKPKQAIVKAQERSSMTNSELLNRLVETHMRAKKNAQKAKLETHQSPSNAGSRRSIHLSNEDKINMKQIQMSAKGLADQMFIEGKYICKEGTSSGSRSFSEALEVLSTSKDLWQNIDRHSSETSVAAKPNDKIVLLKPISRSSYCCENTTCHSPERLSSRVSDGETAHFSLEEIKMKLEQTFGGNSKEPNHFFLDYVPDKLSQNRDNCSCHVIDAKNAFTSSKKNIYRKREYKSEGESDIFTCTTETVRKKLDFPSAGGFSKKQEFDVILEAKRHLSERLNNKLNAGEDPSSKKTPKTLRRILLSPEHDLRPLSPKRDSIYYSSGSAHMICSSPCNSSPAFVEGGFQVQNGGQKASQSGKEVSLRDHFDKPDCPLEILDIRTDDTEYAKSKGQQKIVESNEPELYVSEVPSEMNNADATGTVQSPKAEGFGLEKEDENDSLAEENETFTSAVDDSPSTPSSIQRLDMPDSNKHQEEHQSPVSVLYPFYTEDANSPPSNTSTLRTGPFAAGQSLQPLRLNFEEQLYDPTISTDLCTEDHEYYISQEDQDCIFNYVHSVLQASRLNWDNLSELTPPPEEEDQLLDASLFDQLIEFLPVDCYFIPKLLFDHINEVLLGIYKSHLCLPSWQAYLKPRTRKVTLEEFVVDEVMNEAEFYLFPRTDRRTLDQLVSKDVAHCRQWLDVRPDTEQIVIDLSEDLLEVSILDVLVQLHL